MELKMNLMEQKYEGNSDALQKELVALKQKELDHQEENRLLKERLAGIQDNVDIDLSYDSSNDEINSENDINNDSECSNNEEESDNINDKAKMNVTEGKNVSLQNDSTTLKQENHHQYEENQLLKERLAGIQDDANDDPYYSSSDNNDNNDINYDSECSINEEAGDDCNTTAKQNRTEGNDDALQKELAALKQKELEQYEENQRLKERRARMEEAMQSNGDNDLNYDSSDNEHNDNSATNNIGVKKKDDHALEKERAALKQKELEQHKENQLLRERLARIVAVQDDPHNDPYYNLSDNEEDDKNDITYNTKRRNADKKKGENNTTTNTQQRERHYHSVEIYADPNYDSSDNEDPRNDIYLD
jgi:hypothetical protein